MTLPLDCLPIEFLQRCEAVTRAFEKRDGTWRMERQLLHMYDEVNEVQQAVRKGDGENFKEECCDVILTTLTALHKINVTPTQIQDAMESKLNEVEHRCGIKEF